MWSDAIPVARLMRVAPKKAKIAAVSTGKTIAVLHALVLGALALGCSSGGNQIGASSSITVRCQLCQPGASVPGC